jgi:hypothetical protein
MTRRSPIPWSVFGTLMSAVLVLAGPTPTASASCGDHVRILPAKSSATDDSPPANPATPCNGPGCRQTPDQPPAPAPNSTTPAPTHDAILSAGVVVDSPATSQLPSEVTPSAFHVTPIIFHPPRS